MVNEPRVTSSEQEALSGKIDEILQMLRRIESELHGLRVRIDQIKQIEDDRPLPPLEKVAD